MSEQLRPKTRPNAELYNHQHRQQAEMNLAEIAVLSFIKPDELLRMADAEVTELAAAPELVVPQLSEEELARAA